MEVTFDPHDAQITKNIRLFPDLASILRYWRVVVRFEDVCVYRDPYSITNSLVPHDSPGRALSVGATIRENCMIIPHVSFHFLCLNLLAVRYI